MLKVLQVVALLAFLYVVLRPLWPGRTRAPKRWWNSGQMWMAVMIVIAVVGTIYWIWVRLAGY